MLNSYRNVLRSNRGAIAVNPVRLAGGTAIVGVTGFGIWLLTSSFAAMAASAAAVVPVG